MILPVSRDVVDTEPSNGNVWKMLRGAVDAWFDADPLTITNRAPSGIARPISSDTVYYDDR